MQRPSRLPDRSGAACLHLRVRLSLAFTRVRGEAPGRYQRRTREPPRPESSRRPSLEPPAEVVAPALGKHVEGRCAPHAFDVVAAARVEPRDLRDSKGSRVAGELDDRVSRRDLAIADDGEVEAEEPALEELGHELVTAHPDPELEAGQPRLRHDELGGADADAVADADPVVEQALGGQVLAERARAELELRPLARPELVVLGRVGVDGLVLTAVHAKVGLAVAVEVQTAQRHTAGN